MKVLVARISKSIVHTAHTDTSFFFRKSNHSYATAELSCMHWCTKVSIYIHNLVPVCVVYTYILCSSQHIFTYPLVRYIAMCAVTEKNFVLTSQDKLLCLTMNSILICINGYWRRSTDKPASIRYNDIANPPQFHFLSQENFQYSPIFSERNGKSLHSIYSVRAHTTALA